MTRTTDEKRAALRAALAAGEASGPPRPFDGEAFLKRMSARHGDGKSPARALKGMFGAPGEAVTIADMNAAIAKAAAKRED